MANVVEVTVRGVDETSRVFRDIQSTADKAFSNIESAMDAIPDLDVDATVDTSRAESNLAGIEGAVGEAESAIKSLPDPQIDGNKAESELEEVANAAEEAQDKIEGIDFGAMIGGLAAGGGISGAVEKALNMESLNTQIDITFDVPKESIGAVKDSIKTVQSYGVDAEGALEGVRRQFSLNADASDESNNKIVQGAGAIASAYSDVDFTELIQEVNEIGSELNISDEEALGLTSSLMKIGFPPDQIDTIAEYGKQLTDAGYSAEDVQAIMQSGVETGTWNIDNLLDGLKEGRILMSEFGGGIDDATAELLEGTSISADQLQQWGQAVAGGGEEGKQAMQDVATALNGVEDETLKNQLGVKLFGTMYEDQGQNIIDTLLNAENATVNLKDGQQGVNDAIAGMDSNPAVQMEQAMQNMSTAMAPIFVHIANVVSAIATWASANPVLAGGIVAIATAVTIVTGVLMALGPVITGVKTAMMLFNTTLLANPITWVIVGIMALIAAIILLWQNWDSVSAFLASSWEWIKGVAETVFNGLSSFFTSTWEVIKSTFLSASESLKTSLTTAWESIKTTATNVWNSIKAFFSVVWQGIITVITSAINIVMTTVTTIFNIISTIITTIWNGIKTFFSLVWQGIITIVTTAINVVSTIITTVFNVIKTVITTIWNGIKAFFGIVWQGIVSLITTYINTVQSIITTVFNVIKMVITTVWNGIKAFLGLVWQGILTVITTYINNVQTIITTVFNIIKNVITTIWNGIKVVTSAVWGVIVSLMTTYVNNLRTIITTVFNAIKSVITTIWNVVKSVSTSVWNGIVSVVTAIINRFRGNITSSFNNIKSIITRVWNMIKSVSTNVWNGIRSAISSIINGIRSTISSVFNSIGSTIAGVWNGVKNTTSRIWNSMVGIIKAPINSIIGLINGMINALNGISIKLPKVPDWVPGIGGNGGQTIGFNIPNVPALATGGVVKEPTLAMVGDAGRGNPEIVAPQKMISSIMAQEFGKVMKGFNPGTSGGDGGTTVIEVPIYLDGREIARVTAPHMDRELGTKRHNRNRAEGG